MEVKDKTIRLMIALSFVLGLNVTDASSSQAEVLQGNISKNDTLMRLARPGTSTATSNKMPPTAPPIRLSRGDSAPLTASKPSFDVSTFKNDFKLNASRDDARLGVAKPSDFVSNNKFDLGTERNSRELLVAWERWHKQLSKAIYETWSAMADEPGKSTLKVMVNKNRTIRISVVNTDASPRFNRQLRDAIMSLEGNPGLTFPTKSMRQFVSFEADYIAARNVRPGYSWVKDDVEKVHEHY